jgi:heme oxygenase (biliverdin-IX-beta and delta-forming)
MAEGNIPIMSDDHTPRLAKWLRDMTRSDHHALDHHPLLAVLVRPAITLDDYSVALAALYGAYDAVETALSGFAPDEEFPRRTPDIASDLDELGYPPFPLTVQSTYPDSPAARIGMMYVIEGSNLGGRVIANHLSRHLPSGTPMRFFGKADGEERWERFWRFAHQKCPDQYHSIAVAAARDTFGLFRKHLDNLLGNFRLGADAG